jgi:anti-sigma factor RsiW
MKVTCKDRDRIFEDGTASEWAALESHAATCVACAEELRSWKSLGMAAAELRDYSESPTLWPRIQQALTDNAVAINERRERWSWRSLLANFSLSWQTATAAALVVVLMISLGSLLMKPKPPIQQGSLLRSKALKEA